MPPQVEVLTLTMSEDVDLGTLRTPGLTHLRLVHPRRLDLSPLGGFTSLRSLRVTAERITGLPGPRRVPALEHLHLIGGCDPAELRVLARGWRLRVVKLTRVPELHGLQSLAFLAGPVELRLERLHLVDVDEIGWWAGTLERLALRDCGTLDLGPVAALENLVVLDLTGTMVFDLRSLATLRRLSRLTLSSARDVRSLEPVARLPNLREIRFTQGSPVNLAAFAGRRGLRVMVEGMLTKVVGADLLGEGSEVVQWDGK